MAIVQGPKDETLGVVTMSDVLDALFEDIFPDGPDEEAG
jgi:CBS domain containing-hemolysin-like protein